MELVKNHEVLLWRQSCYSQGELEFLLPKQPIMHQNHHKALACDLPILQSLIQLEGMSSLALQFLILTAARTIEVIKAQWNEFDLIRLYG